MDWFDCLAFVKRAVFSAKRLSGYGVVLGVLLTVHCPLQAAPSVQVFYDNEFPLTTLLADIDQLEALEQASVLTYNIDAKNNATQAINRWVNQWLQKQPQWPPNTAIESRYREGFSALINNQTQWLPIYKTLEQGGQTLSKVLHYKIKKVPAFVFNERAIVYGVNSLTDALTKYHAYQAQGDSQ